MMFLNGFISWFLCFHYFNQASIWKWLLNELLTIIIYSTNFSAIMPMLAKNPKIYLKLICWILMECWNCAGCVDKSWCEGNFSYSWARHHKQRSSICHSQRFQHMDPSYSKRSNGRSRPIHVPGEYTLFTNGVQLLHFAEPNKYFSLDFNQWNF